ncbi:phosphate/phosphite/phosphonate ABC transporter substrate-binding protein [Allorhizocola rhizosphaerae]|uniref:phosphate/phosphite/phosphonate ABC transporter substrate-binding protein n=1 Tax=Allorhizocola rhizosphaerae TaxID=1872709 RepID=UPI000E3C23DC|nr:phosphate/phosphite/phosphonate ABC transporter substrate-binding protein [Allorhizocola rhizosphaerae]
MAAALLAAASVTACGKGDSGPASSGTGWPDKLVFAAVPSGEAKTFEAHYGLFINALSEELGIKIETFLAADYAGVIEALIADKVDIAQLGAFSYALAVQNGANVEPSGVLHHRKGDKPGYVIQGIAPAASPVSSLEGFRGKTVCFPDPASTTTLLPLFEFAKANMVPDKDFKRLTVPAGTAIPRTVKKGDCEVGLAADVQMESATKAGDIGAGDLKVFWTMQAPGSPIATRTALPQDLREKIKTAAVKINADYLAAKGVCTGDKCLISSNRDFGYLPVEHSYYQIIWDACKATKVTACGPLAN